MNFHPDAAQNFNSKADSLAKAIEEFTSPKKTRNQNSFMPEFHAVVVEPINFTEGTNFILDDEGEINAVILFTHKGHSLGLSFENYKKFVKLIDGLEKSKLLSGIASKIFLNNVLLDWIQKTYLHQNEKVFVDFLSEECTGAVKDFEVWMPICQTYVETSFTIGDLTIQSVTKQMFDDWEGEIIDNLAKNPNSDLAGAKSLIKRKRMTLQGLAAATINLRAEREKAAEIAFSKAEVAVSLLRIFSPANFHPNLTSYCDLLGRENIQSYDYLIMEKSNSFSFVSGVASKEFQDWRIDSNYANDIKTKGLDRLSSILNSSRKTDFENDVLDALFLYSKSCLKSDISDKLVYILVPLETLLLKDENEPIMQNIAERLALLIGNTIEERRKIFSNVKAVYSIRSKFIHHGKKPGQEETEILREFMFNAWRFFILIIDNSQRFPNKLKAIEAVDNMKFSGGII